MAFKTGKRRALNALTLISLQDDAVDWDKSNKEEYRKTADANHLVFLPNMQPTKFLVNFDLSGKQAQAIKNGMLAGRDDNGDPQVTLGTWAHRVVKHTLKDIQNPEGMPEDEKLVMKKDENGLVHDDLLGQLDRFGVVDEIFGFFTRLVTANTVKDNAKN